LQKRHHQPLKQRQQKQRQQNGIPNFNSRLDRSIQPRTYVTKSKETRERQAIAPHLNLEFSPSFAVNYQPSSSASFPGSHAAFPNSSVSSSPSADDPFEVGFEYLAQVRQLALSPDMIDVGEAIHQRIRVYQWIGDNIRVVNLLLNAYLHACHQCFAADQRPVVRIMAAPLAAQLGLDGFCNTFLQPTPILIDIGRIAPQDWICVVAHEYAHAYLQSPGHHAQFLAVLNHLCLGLGLAPLTQAEPLSPEALEQQLRHWPPCMAQSESLAVWRGDRTLFANAKATEDLIQHRFGHLFPGDFA
jgi:hypothetical protein